MKKLTTLRHKDVIDYPGGGKTVILLHGFLSSKKYWDKVANLLSLHNYHVIAVDLLGFGNAIKPKNIDYTYDDHVQHVNDTIRRLRIKDDIILVGHSMGALLAMRYAHDHPDSISRLVLVSPPMYKSSQQAKETLRETSVLYRILLDSRYRHILWIILRCIGPFAKHTRYSREGSLANVIDLAHFFDDIRHVTVPTRLLIGRRDREVYLENLHKETVGDTVQIVIEETGHHAPQTDAKFVVDQIISTT